MNGLAASNGCVGFDDDIVVEWADKSKSTLDIWRGLSKQSQDYLVEKERDANGITRPTGYKVSFHYNARVEGHHFGSGHPMKPWRLTLTKQLIMSYGLQYAMDIYEARLATKDELAEFHTKEYLEFLER
jgi:histone deacetylase HOS2